MTAQRWVIVCSVSNGQKQCIALYPFLKLLVLGIVKLITNHLRFKFTTAQDLLLSHVLEWTYQALKTERDAQIFY